MCWTCPFKLRWSRGHIHNSSYYHHQIGSNLSHCCHIFSWLCAWGGCTIICCWFCIYIPGQLGFVSFIIVQSYDACKWSSTLWPDGCIRLFAHYIISLSSLCWCIWRYWTSKMLVRYILSECKSEIKSIFLVTFCAIYGVVCIQLTHLSYGDCENTCTLSYYHHQIGSVSHLPLFRSWNNGMRCMSFYILIKVIPYRYEWIGSIFTLIFLAWNMSWCVVSIFFLICHYLQHYTAQSALKTFLQNIIYCKNIFIEVNSCWQQSILQYMLLQNYHNRLPHFVSMSPNSSWDE